MGNEIRRWKELISLCCKKLASMESVGGLQALVDLNHRGEK